MSAPYKCHEGGSCFYCDGVLSSRHEHDHWPLAKRHGGTETVTVCLNCHDLKDRIRLDNWPGDLAFKAFRECSPIARILVAKVSALLGDANKERQERAA